MRGGYLLALLVLALALVLAARHGRDEAFGRSDPFALAMQRMDTNRNGRLSRDEYVRYGRAADFERYDLDRDGLVDAPEYRTAFLGEEPDPALIDPLLRMSNAPPQQSSQGPVQH